MTSNKRDILAVILFSILFTFLFHQKALGLNLLIAEVVLISWLVFSKQFQFKGLYPISVGIGFVITSLATIFTHSLFSYILHFIVFFIFIGLIIYPQTKSLLNSVGQAFSNIFESQGQFFRKLTSSRIKGRKLSTYTRKASIFVIPILIILFFVYIYRNSNPVFDGLVNDTWNFIGDKLNSIFATFDFLLFMTFIICLFISIFLLIRIPNKELIKLDKNANEKLQRKRRIELKYFRPNGLINEYKSGVFLLVILNLMILVLNFIDIKWVWFNFEWEGQYLKQFVHEGTYLLIFSIIISIVLVLFYFRKNLNFYKNNKLLKYLSYIWLIQNGILTISVAVRNFWYINYFALAYKRIGVIIFLILCLYGLYTVFMKVKHRKSRFYLFKTNFNAFVLVLVISSLFNWDSIIAKYNFRNSDTSFLHLNYMSTLSDKSLPYLDKTLLELEQIEIIQNEKFPFGRDYMTSERYFNVIEMRKENFRDKWESKGFLSWNYPEYKAYQKLFKD
ncbi:DUF4173 domain-containing protein [Brumimicrobium glaciale]|uniref:DUF4173 domain-containing protein n=1 Tax=Brumimicrobium glaciale TaxID=200475 RepID=A0A4Q4KMU6_9FLAO|nr:DUF4173 domain-containing protein [Brumimicrobium glaciale]RYM34662.1 DUF4173 domain-containing protein [Brumimicrobium glaciale]